MESRQNSIYKVTSEGILNYAPTHFNNCVTTECLVSELTYIQGALLIDIAEALLSTGAISLQLSDKTNVRLQKLCNITALGARQKTQLGVKLYKDTKTQSRSKMICFKIYFYSSQIYLMLPFEQCIYLLNYIYQKALTAPLHQQIHHKVVLN